MSDSLFVTKLRKTRSLKIEGIEVNLYLDVLKRPSNTKNKYGLFIDPATFSFLRIEKENHRTVSISLDDKERALNVRYGKPIDIYIPYHIEDISLTKTDAKIFNIYNSMLNNISLNSSNVKVKDDILLEKLKINSINDSTIRIESNLAINDLELELENTRINFLKENLLLDLKFNIYNSTIKFSEYSLIYNISDFNLMGSSFASLSLFYHFIIKNMSQQSKFFTYSKNYHVESHIQKRGQNVFDNIVKESNDFMKLIEDKNIHVDIKYTIEEFIKNQDFISVKNRIIKNNSLSDYQEENSFSESNDDEPLELELDDFEYFDNEENNEDISDEDFLNLFDDKSETVYKNNFKNLLSVLTQKYPTEHLNDSNRDKVRNELKLFINDQIYKDKDKKTLRKIEKLCFVLDINFKRNKACSF